MLLICAFNPLWKVQNVCLDRLCDVNDRLINKLSFLCVWFVYRVLELTDCFGVAREVTAVNPVFPTDVLWACGTDSAAARGSFCMSIDAALGSENTRFPFRWTSITTVIQTSGLPKVMLSGQTFTSSSTMAELAVCVIDPTGLSCSAKSLDDIRVVAGAYVPFINKVVYIGTTKSIYSSVSIIDYTTSSVRSYIYTSTTMSTISLLYIQSPPNFIGAFIAGTCVSSASINYIFAGMVRTDSGTMTAMYLSPAKGSILDSAELVNAMALEPLGPDSFIAGGLQLSDKTGMHAYLVCVNSLYRRFVYGMRYIIRNGAGGDRRALLEGTTRNSVVKGMVLVERTLFMIISSVKSGSAHDLYGVTVLKTDMATGSIIKQVHIFSHNASMQCTDVANVGISLVIACTVQYTNNTNTTQSVVLSVDRELTFSKLPEQFMRTDQNIFVAEPVLFKSTLLSLTVQSGDVKTVDYAFNTAGGISSINPSVTPIAPPSMQPSSAPSGQPSSSPTATPSVSPQPTSQPSTSGPTNSCKPTVKPTLLPTAKPSIEPSAAPSHKPSSRPTLRPSVSPTTHPSTSPSATPISPGRTNLPSVKPIRNPTIRSTNTPTATPTLAPTTAASSQKGRGKYKAREATILGYTAAGLFGLWVLYQMWWWGVYRAQEVERDKKRVREMLAQNLPGKTRYPVSGAAIRLCCAHVTEDTDDAVVVPSNTVAAAPSATPPQATSAAFTGQGAYIEGPERFVDLESNMPQRSNKSTESRNILENQNRKTEEQEETVGDLAVPSSEIAIKRKLLEQQTAVRQIGEAQVGDGSDLSEVSSVSEESAEGSDSPSVSSSEGEAGIVEPRKEHSYDTAGSESDEPSDDSDVLYSLSSDDENNSAAADDRVAASEPASGEVGSESES